MDCYRGNRARKARKWHFQCPELPPSTDSRDFLSKIKNRIFENFKIFRSPLDLGCHLVDLTSLNLIVPPLIWCYNDFLQHLFRHLEILSHLINKKCARSSRSAHREWKNALSRHTFLQNSLVFRWFSIALHLPSLLPKIRKLCN